MNVLVTGGGGFIGSHLVESQLTKGNFVKSIDLQDERLDQVRNHPNLKIIKGDIRDEQVIKQAVQDTDVIYHLAAAHLDVNLSTSYYWEVNVAATVHLLEQAHHAGVKRFLHCSSTGVYGELKEIPADEETPCHPTNNYELTKLRGEEAALKFHQETGFPVVVVRPSWVYGPRCPRTEKLVRHIRKGRFVIFGNGKTLRHPIFVADLVRGMELCLNSDHLHGQVYIIAGKMAMTIEELLQTVAKVTNGRLPRMHLPIVLGKTAGIVIQNISKPLGIHPPFSRRSLDFFVKDNSYEIRKASTDLGFDAQVELDEGMQMTLHYLNQSANKIEN